MALKKALEGMMGYKTVAQLRIQEHNEEALLRHGILSKMNWPNFKWMDLMMHMAYVEP